MKKSTLIGSSILSVFILLSLSIIPSAQANLIEDEIKNKIIFEDKIDFSNLLSTIFYILLIIFVGSFLFYFSLVGLAIQWFYNSLIDEGYPEIISRILSIIIGIIYTFFASLNLAWKNIIVILFWPLILLFCDWIPPNNIINRGLTE